MRLYLRPTEENTGELIPHWVSHLVNTKGLPSGIIQEGDFIGIENVRRLIDYHNDETIEELKILMNTNQKRTEEPEERRAYSVSRTAMPCSSNG